MGCNIGYSSHSMRIWFFRFTLCCLLGSSLNGIAQVLVPRNTGAVTPLAWGDYDNDGDMDLLQHNGTALRILKNNLAGTTATFADAGITLVSLNPSSVGWIDFNSDGYLDIYYLDSGSLKIFVSQGGVSFTQTTVNLGGESLSSIADWGDIDNDGDQDILATGVIMRNEGGNRFEVSQRLGSTGRAEFLDFDNDGDLDFYNRDFLYTNKGLGVYELDRSISPYSSDTDYQYRDFLFFTSENGSKRFATFYSFNTGFQGLIEIWDFFLCGGGNPGMNIQYLNFTDFDNDGKNDALVFINGSIYLYPSIGDCSTIAELAIPVGRTGVADFDRDGDIDVFIGNNVYENTTVTVNAAPSVPGNLTSAVEVVSAEASTVTLNWAAATDDKTAPTSLTYNLIVKRGPDVVITDGLGANGKQVLTQRGNAGFLTSAKISNLPRGKYTWTVQAVDEGFRTSALAAEKSFEITSGPDLITSLAVSSKYSASYDEVNDRYLLTYIKNGNVMGLYADGKAVQPSGTEFIINTASSAVSHTVGFNTLKNEFMVSWLEVSGSNKKIYAKNLLATGSNLHAEKVIYSRSDTLTVFLGGDKIAVDPVSGKYMIPVFQTRTDLDRPKVKFFGEPITYYPYGLLDVFAMKVSSSGTTITNETPKLLQTVSIPSNFNEPPTRIFSVPSAVEYDHKRKMYCVAWNFMGERRTGYGGGSSGEITSVLLDNDVKLITADDNLVTKSIGSTGSRTPRNLSLTYNSYSEQLFFVWSGWQESTNGSGSNDYTFEVYQQIFSIEADGSFNFRNTPTLVSKPPGIINYGSGLPVASWSRKRNEYLIVWNKGIASGNLGVLGEGDIFWRRVSPVTFDFIDDDSRFLSGYTGNESIVRYNGKAGHFLLGWHSGSQNLLSSFSIPKDLPPIVTAVAPIKAGAGAKIIVTGNRLGNVPSINKVMFGTIEAVVDPVFPFPNDPSKIQVTVPAGLTREKVPVTITYDDQVSNATILFENITETSVTAVAPLEGEAGDVVTINGTNFPVDKSNFTVKFGSAVAAPEDVISNSDTEIKVKVPAGAIRGIQTVSVVIQEIPNDYKNGGFRVISIPVISTVAPDDEDQKEFIAFRNIRVTGSNLSQQPGDITIKLNDVVIPAQNISVATTTELVFRIPMGLRGENQLTVSTIDGDVTGPAPFNIFLGSAVVKSTGNTEMKFTKTDDAVDLFAEVYSRRTVQEVKFRTRGISAGDSDWKSQTVTGLFDNNRIEFGITEAEFTDDPLGLEAYFEVTDSSALTETSAPFKIFKNYLASGETTGVPELDFGGDVSDYNIIAIPYVLSPNKINTVFKSILDNYGYDKSKWRIAHYVNEGSSPEYKEYLAGLDNIDPGKGYWIIVRNQQDITFEKGQMPNTSGGPFNLVLQPGWNQVGNPYDFNLSWSDIKSYNNGLGTGTDDLEPYKTFQKGTFVTTDVIERFRGGFIRNNSNAAVSLLIPFMKNTAINSGRVADERSFPSDLVAKEWRVALALSAGTFGNHISSFGMHPASVDGEDRQDEHRLPAFAQALDLSFAGSLAASVVATNDHHTWDFKVFNTTDNKEITLHWDNARFGDNDRALFLHDKRSERLIDMRTASSYTFTYSDGHPFSLYFGDQSYVEQQSRPTSVVLSDAHPNPMKGTTIIPFTVTRDQTHVQLAIFNLQGQEITTLVNNTLPAGFYELEWNGKSAAGEAVAPGLVMYRLHTTQPVSGTQSIVKKLVIAP